MKKLIMGLIIITAVMLLSATANAKTLTRYTTRTVSLKTYSKRTVYRVPRNTRLTQLSSGRIWSKVKYKNCILWIHTKWLHAENLPGKKQAAYNIKYLRTRAPIHWRGRKYTYYTSRQFPVWKLPVPGLHLDRNGIWCDKDGYIVLGSSVSNKINRLVVATPFGKYGKVYDTGGYSTPGWLMDTAVSW